MSAMAMSHLFDSQGSWIAFRKGKYVYDRDGNWIGWLPWNDDDVVDRNSAYLATIVRKKRLYRFASHPYRGYPGYASCPGYPGYPGYPSHAGYDPPPLGAEDVNLLEIEPREQAPALPERARC